MVGGVAELLELLGAGVAEVLGLVARGLDLVACGDQQPCLREHLGGEGKSVGPPLRVAGRVAA